MPQTNKLLEGYSVEVQVQIARIQFKLSQLGFNAAFSRMDEGPILRTFYFEPALDALFSRVTSKEEEIAGALKVDAARLYRNAGLLAVEIPRLDRQLIRFDSCIHEMFSRQDTEQMHLPLLMGQNPKGEYLYADLAAQPHLLIAGATGSGKSVATSELICSMALMRSPKQLEFILVDTKNLDLVLFRDLDHVSEIITDVDALRSKLQDLLREHDRRTALMSGFARNIREWNALGMGEALRSKVLIIDELADVFERDASLRAGFDKDEKAAFPAISALLKRIAQVSRATGIHIICATQRPSVGMVTGDSRIKFGDIKANFPARFCFKLPTMADSRVVLDENGAEMLLGKGDYLYKIAGNDLVQRAHSAFVSMEDIALILSQHAEIRRTYASVRP
jgi:DNA segregation ATPase FtsK/SpoIIIE, S-DNA-T family